MAGKRKTNQIVQAIHRSLEQMSKYTWQTMIKVSKNMYCMSYFVKEVVVHTLLTMFVTFRCRREGGSDDPEIVSGAGMVEKR